MIDKFISDFIREYHVLLKNFFAIGGIIVCFVIICGAIRFGIAAYRRHKGIYPPATSQMEHH
ncbi:MAG: hypothetical protein MUC95_02090 [Spirochaetes bacterium]|jgi:hypothetical protein|nr:hypothetical protein [Spirochaetota bacterium]